MDNEGKRDQLQAVTGLDPETCTRLLEAHAFDLERTISNYYDQPVPQPSFIANAMQQQHVFGPVPRQQDPTPASAATDTRMLQFSCSYGELTKEIILGDSSCIGDFKQIASLELSIPYERVRFINWPPMAGNKSDNTRLSTLSLPLINQIVVADSLLLPEDLTTTSASTPNPFAMSVDAEINDLSRSHPIEIRNMDDDSIYKLDCEGVKTFGELKEDIANLSTVPRLAQNWEGYIGTQDDNNTISSILGRQFGANQFSFRRDHSHPATLPGNSSAAAPADASSTFMPPSFHQRPSFPISINFPTNGGSGRSSSASRRSSQVESRATSMSSPVENNGSSAASASSMVAAGSGAPDSDDELTFDSDDCSYFDSYMDNDFSFRTNSRMMPEDAEDEKTALEQFKAEFVKRYGNSGPNFRTVVLADTIQEAFGGGARSRKPLAIYLHNDKSISANVFCTQILCKEAVASYMNSNYIAWAWDMTSDANKHRFMESCKRHFGSAVADSVREIKVDNYPLIVLVQGKGRTCEVNGIMQGNVDLSEVMATLMRVHEQTEHEREQDIREERARQDRDQIIMEQEEAYKRSLDIDRQKRIDKEQDELRIENRNRQKRDAQQIKNEEIARLRSLVGPEPTAQPGVNLYVIRFRTPIGSNINRAFLASEPIQALVDFAGAQGYLSSQYQILKSFPKTNISALVMSQSLEGSVINKREAVTLEEIEGQNEEEEEYDDEE